MSSKSDLDDKQIHLICEQLYLYVYSSEASSHLNVIEDLYLKGIPSSQSIKIFAVKSKYASGSISTIEHFANKHLWTLWSVVSRLKVYKRQLYIKDNNTLNSTINGQCPLFNLPTFNLPMLDSKSIFLNAETASL